MIICLVTPEGGIRYAGVRISVQRLRYGSVKDGSNTQLVEWNTMAAGMAGRVEGDIEFLRTKPSSY